jgi:hypothetical protein
LQSPGEVGNSIGQESPFSALVAATLQDGVAVIGAR